MYFLDIPDQAQNPAQARVRILPIPYEASTSWKQGTARGPAALLEASHHIEFYDEELGRSLPETIGPLFTCDPLLPAGEPAEVMEQIRQEAAHLINNDGLLISIGGEHSITHPLVEAHLAHFKSLSVLQVDAHADLRSEYEGSRFNHACPMRRVNELGVHVTAVGIRSVDESEAALLNGPLRKTFLDYQTAGRFRDFVPDIIDSLPTENVYITIDMDGLSPGVAPAVGTPMPGGLEWHDLMALLRETARRKTIVGADVVELMPVPGLHCADIAAAKIIYKLLGYMHS